MRDTMRGSVALASAGKCWQVLASAGECIGELPYVSFELEPDPRSMTCKFAFRDFYQRLLPPLALSGGSTAEHCDTTNGSKTDIGELPYVSFEVEPDPRSASPHSPLHEGNMKVT
jgi:hypothetical protein